MFFHEFCIPPASSAPQTTLKRKPSWTSWRGGSIRKSTTRPWRDPHEKGEANFLRRGIAEITRTGDAILSSDSSMRAIPAMLRRTLCCLARLTRENFTRAAFRNDQRKGRHR